MILIVLAALCVVSVPLTGGKLGRLAELRLQRSWAAALALGLQIIIVTVAPGGNRMLHDVIHIGTYGLVGLFVWANRHIPGVPVIATGALANLIAIVSNGGVMPASATAEHLAGLTQGAGFHNTSQLVHPSFQWLGDLIPVPAGPMANILSLGDCVIYAGMLLLMHRVCRRPPASATEKPAARWIARGLPRGGVMCRARRRVQDDHRQPEPRASCVSVTDVVRRN